MATSTLLHLNDVEVSLRFNPAEEEAPAKVTLGQGILYALVGTTLGLLAGTAAAVGPWSGSGTLMAHGATQTTVSAPVTFSGSEQHALRAPSGAATNNFAVSNAAAVVPASYLVTLPHASAAAPVHHAAVKPMIQHTLAPSAPVETPVEAAAAPVAPAAVAMTSAVAPEVTENNTQSAELTTEGDLSVADFDATTGTVETREGKSFSVTTAGADGNTLAWQDYAGNIHYRCTQAGSCTLSGAGIGAASARLI